MRVGMYNRWLATLGGGEKHSLAIAEWLSQRHAVTVLSHAAVPRELAASRLNLDLSRVEFATIPDAQEIANLSAQFDLFINASHMDFFPSRAPHSAALIYFPASFPLETALKLRRRAGFVAKRWLKLPSFVEGVVTMRWVNDAILCDYYSPLKIKLPPARLGYQVHFDLQPDRNATAAHVLLDGVSVPATRTGAGGWTHYRMRVPPSGANRAHEILIQTQAGKLTHFVIENPRYCLFRLLFESRLGERWGKRLLHLSPTPNSILESMDTYDAIWANSRFTQKWIARYWNRDSQVLYPPVDVECFQATDKRKQILSVGRFFAGSHNKKHQVMIAAFKEMVDQGLTGWELHLAGGKTPGDEHTEYLRQVYADAQGYPVVIHPDIPFDDLVTLYSESAIYWHAGGYGEDENSDPIRFEHFGITTVEAMASGCVPVVIAKGGQPEIVKHQRNGFLWETIAELKALTWQVIRDESLRQSLSEVAVRNSRRYGKAQFCATLQSELQKMGLERGGM